MTPEQFAYWLQGFAEIASHKAPSEQEWKIIKDHLATVFNKVTPTYGPGINNPLPAPMPWNPNKIWESDPNRIPPTIMC